MLRATAALALALTIASDATAQDDPVENLRRVLEDVNAAGSDLWIYNDIERGMEAARKTGKPLFVTFRCVPCTACKGFDASVAKGSGEVHRLAREKFISVRQVEMKDVDLSLFRFDHDLNWAAMFVHPDGVVYARYGTQSAEGPDAYNSLEGLANTMKRVLELHEEYPRNRAELAGKRLSDAKYDSALEMRGMRRKDKLRGETSRGNCIHCHMIHDAEHEEWQAGGKKVPRKKLDRYPLPENVGLIIDADDGLKVKEIEAGSPAARAGLEVGESITHMGGQAMTSIADMQWVLHHLPHEATELLVTGSESGAVTLRLEEGWKTTDFTWRGSIGSLSPRLRVWAPELGEGEQEELGIPAEKTALLVKWINTGEPGGRAAREAGLREGDVIVELEGKPLESGMGPREFNLHIKMKYNVGDKLPLVVLRKGERRKVEITLVE